MIYSQPLPALEHISYSASETFPHVKMSEIVVVYALVAFRNNQTLGHANGKETNATFFRQVFLVNCDWLSAAEDCALPNHSMKISYLSLYANMKSNDLLFLLLTFFPTLQAFNVPSFFWTTVTIYYWYFLFKFHSFTLTSHFTASKPCVSGFHILTTSALCTSQFITLTVCSYRS